MTWEEVAIGMPVVTLDGLGVAVGTMRHDGDYLLVSLNECMPLPFRFVEMVRIVRSYPLHAVEKFEAYNEFDALTVSQRVAQEEGPYAGTG